AQVARHSGPVRRLVARDLSERPQCSEPRARAARRRRRQERETQRRSPSGPAEGQEREATWERGGAGADGGGRTAVVVGAMGVGKTTVGRRLARELQRPFADADEQLELRAGRTIPAIFRDDGGGAFRPLESEILADLLGRTHPLVVAAGGGVVIRAGNRALLGRRAFVVWLRASAAFLAARADPTHRPLLTADADPAGAP